MKKCSWKNPLIFYQYVQSAWKSRFYAIWLNFWRYLFSSVFYRLMISSFVWYRVSLKWSSCVKLLISIDIFEVRKKSEFYAIWLNFGRFKFQFAKVKHNYFAFCCKSYKKLLVFIEETDLFLQRLVRWLNSHFGS